MDVDNAVKDILYRNKLREQLEEKLNKGRHKQEETKDQKSHVSH